MPVAPTPLADRTKRWLLFTAGEYTPTVRSAWTVRIGSFPCFIGCSLLLPLLSLQSWIGDDEISRKRSVRVLKIKLRSKDGVGGIDGTHCYLCTLDSLIKNLLRAQTPMDCKVCVYQEPSAGPKRSYHVDKLVRA